MNKNFKKIVAEFNEGLICESDDIVVLYDSRIQAVCHWFVKQDRCRLKEKELEVLHCLSKWTPANPVKHRLEIHRATEELGHITDLIHELML